MYKMRFHFYLPNNFEISLISFLNNKVSTILEIANNIIIIPREVVNAIVPKFGLIIIIKPQTIDINEQINIDNQLL